MMAANLGPSVPRMPALTAQVGHTFKACHFGRLYFFWSSLMVKQLTCSVALSLVMLLTGTGAALAHSEKQDHDAHWAKRPPVISLQSEAVDRKSTRLNSSHVKISYAVFCLKKKKYNRKK